MGELRNCPDCGKLFVRLNRNLCSDCAEKEEEEFEKVRLYLKENRGISVDKASEETGVETKKIIKWVREGRIEADLKGFFLNCRRCGVEIEEGNFCANCAKALASQFEDATGSIKNGGSGNEQFLDPKKKGMYSADRVKDKPK